ncbi:hypothetical protein RO3G_01312 [Rhizopus delemar RA 99-880]|uniref:Uncharacterized protein n=1 Tax=Rhizopus delemar (strain RA 99-880 / ATCC MYA-4621 / FGSC 9543 / NRRL 43880) TaxID=246409 RepID=I1BK78_RHIO9|nr:hypothetical protein RO3G_01312 [Rhizopus delemar RA 99-880]|eukprot:EIE76608.1 hypothetical protein RO3G_01312 [Rhizopus delemar RA 99-880]
MARIESEIMEQQEASMNDDEENEQENNEVILDEPLIQNNQSITDDSWFYELCMSEYYEQYRSLLEQQAMINRQKEIVAKSFAQNVTEWAHLKFKRPGNNQRDIYLYETAKYNQLKTILPNCTVYRTLVTKMKNHDQWGQLMSQTEVGSSLGGGICDAVGQVKSFEVKLSSSYHFYILLSRKLFITFYCLIYNTRSGGHLLQANQIYSFKHKSLISNSFKL